VSRDDVQVAPRGAYHPGNRCTYCGADDRRHLVYFVHKDTHAEAARCADTVACLRRARDRRQLELFPPGVVRAMRD
jgi:hypothetical protein